MHYGESEVLYEEGAISRSRGPSLLTVHNDDTEESHYKEAVNPWCEEVKGEIFTMHCIVRHM